MFRRTSDALIYTFDGKTIFVAAGYLFAKYLLRRCVRKTALYLLLSGISAVIIAVYMIAAIPDSSGMMGSILRFHHIQIQDAMICIAGALFSLGVYHLLFGRMSAGIRKIIIGVSKNINPLYCIQWVVIAWFVGIWVRCGKPAFSDGAILLIGLGIFLLSAAGAQVYSALRSARHAKNG